MRYVQVTHGEVTQVAAERAALPEEGWKHPDPDLLLSVSGSLVNLSDEELAELGWLPVDEEPTKPVFDENKEFLVEDGYEVLSDGTPQLRWRTEPLPTPAPPSPALPPPPPTAHEILASSLEGAKDFDSFKSAALELLTTPDTEARR